MKKAEKKPIPRVTPPNKPTKTVKNARDKIARAQAIKLFCIECMGYQKSMVKKCTDQACPLWPFRTGAGQEHTDVPIRK